MYMLVHRVYFLKNGWELCSDTKHIIQCQRQLGRLEEKKKKEKAPDLKFLILH